MSAHDIPSATGDYGDGRLWEWRTPFRRKHTDYLLTGHKCEPVAEMLMDEGREWWLGRLTEPIPEWPRETHCLHITTPIKSVVLGLCPADFDQLVAICYVGLGRHTSQRWVERVASGMGKRAERRAS